MPAGKGRCHSNAGIHRCWRFNDAPSIIYKYDDNAVALDMNVFQSYVNFDLI